MFDVGIWPVRPSITISGCPAALDVSPLALADAPFAVDAAAALGVSPSRLRVEDLDRPFAGVRSAAAPAATVLALAGAYSPILTPGEFFSHATSAVLHGLWLPARLEQGLQVHVSVHRPQRAPRDRRVVGHHLIPREHLLERWAGLPIAGEVETWCQLATLLSLHDLVVAGDSLLAKGRPHPEATLAAMRSAAADPFRPRAKALRRAVEHVRIGHRSPRESRLRLLLLQAALPEFEINAEIFDDGGTRVSESDLVHFERKIALEYEGDQHRSDPRQFRKDLLKYERMQDLGWRVVRVTTDDLELHSDELLTRVAALFRD